MARNVTFHDKLREQGIFKHRLVVAFLGVLALVGVLLLRMYHLQIVQYSTYETISDRNRIQIEPIAPTRGLILDRNGTILADNNPTFSVSIIKELVPNLSQTIADIRELIPLNDNDVQRFEKRLQQRRRPLTPIALRLNLTEEEIAILSVRAYDLPGVIIEANLVRHYPQPELLSHTIGYVGRINEAELKQVDANNYGATEYIGKTGIEKFYEDRLHGTVGFQKVETDARGRTTRVLEKIDPTGGENLHLFLDLPTQQAALKAMNGRRGAVVAIEPDTGGVLAFLSTPGFNSNLFVTGIDHKSYNDLQNDRWRPLFNRALQGQYPPGSTVKPMVGLAGLDGGFIDWNYSIWDPGWYKINGDGRFFRDWKKWGHGFVTLDTAIVQSCDTYFYELAHRMGVDRLHDFLSPFGFGHRTGIDMAGEVSGVLPSTEWKRRTRKERWYPGESLNFGIGQGYMLSTPLQLAVATAIIANHGTIIEPRMVEKISTKDTGIRPLEHAPLQHIKLRDPEQWRRMIASMRNVVMTKKGTAYGAVGRRLTEYDMAGKTGTAQVVNIKQGETYQASKLKEWHRDHAWFMGFAPTDHPRIAVAVLVENGGHGGTDAGPVAKQVIDAWFESDARSRSVTPEEQDASPATEALSTSQRMHTPPTGTEVAIH
ncbi:Penicillin-binding protein 2 [gamma proteobacterium HdN1]|nr:Penicillin-binding protein 2 [gamma proteobacterium HdN1]